MANTIGNPKSPKIDPPARAALELEGAPQPLSEGEREESLIERENALAAREARLIAMEARMMETMERLERKVNGQATEEDIAARDTSLHEMDEQGKRLPWLDMDASYGIIYGDAIAAFTQNGHVFGPDRKYLRDEPRGTGKPFNIAMLGLIRAVKKVA